MKRSHETPGGVHLQQQSICLLDSVERTDGLCEYRRSRTRLQHGVASKQFIELAGPAAEGVRLPAAALLIADKLPDNDPQKPVAVNYSRTYQQKTGQATSTFGGHAYDGLMILVQAMQRAKSADTAKVRDEIERTKGFVGTGGIVNMSPTDHMGLDLSAFRMLEIKGGDWTMIPGT